MEYAIFLAAWLLIGGAIGIVDARHGGWHRGFVGMAVLGPFALPLAVGRRRAGSPAPSVLATGTAAGGSVDLLIGIDGSDASMSAASSAVGMLGGCARRVTLATVLDIDTARPRRPDELHPEPWPEQLAAREHLETAATRLTDCNITSPGVVVLAGDPAEALERYAVEESYDVIVIGSHGAGFSKLVLGSCASRLAKRTGLPVLIVPPRTVTGEPGSTGDALDTAALRPPPA